jgi:hypothetical protein
MGVDYCKCDECGNIEPDCGDNYPESISIDGDERSICPNCLSDMDIIPELDVSGGMLVRLDGVVHHYNSLGKETCRDLLVKARFHDVVECRILASPALEELGKVIRAVMERTPETEQTEGKEEKKTETKTLAWCWEEAGRIMEKARIGERRVAVEAEEETKMHKDWRGEPLPPDELEKARAREVERRTEDDYDRYVVSTGEDFVEEWTGLCKEVGDEGREWIAYDSGSRVYYTMDAVRQMGAREKLREEESQLEWLREKVKAAEKRVVEIKGSIAEDDAQVRQYLDQLIVRALPMWSPSKLVGGVTDLVGEYLVCCPGTEEEGTEEKTEGGTEKEKAEEEEGGKKEKARGKRGTRPGEEEEGASADHEEEAEEGTRTSPKRCKQE